MESYRGKTVLIFGATGFVGTYLVQHLLAQGAKITLVAHKNIPYQWMQKCRIIATDLSHLNFNEYFKQAPDFIFHTARVSALKNTQKARQAAGTKGAKMNAHLVGQIKRNGWNCPLAFVSGTLMYGHQSHVNEDSALSPISFAKEYGHAEKPILALQAQNYPVVIFRLPWIMGNGSWFKWFYYAQTKHSGKVPIYGNGAQNMTLIHLTDAVKTMANVLLHPQFPKVLNVTNNIQITQREFADVLAQKLGCTIEMKTGVTLSEEETEALTFDMSVTTHYPNLISCDFSSAEMVIDHTLNELSASEAPQQNIHQTL